MKKSNRPNRLGRPFSASSENPRRNYFRHLSWGSVPYGVMVKGTNVTCGFQAAVRSPSQGFSPSKGFTSPDTVVVLFHTTTPMGLTPPAYSPAQVHDPFPDSVPSCRYFHSRFFSEEKEAKKVARLQGFAPCAGPCIPFHRGEIRYRTAHGVLPLSRFPPFDQVPEYNPHVLGISGTNKFDPSDCTSGRFQSKDWLGSFEPADAFEVFNLSVSQTIFER